MATKPILGVWMPTGEILCVNCHKPMPGFNPGPEFLAQGNKPLDSYDGKELATCDRCKSPVVLLDQAVTASEQRVRDHLNGAGYKAQMHQTGGMCSACVVHSDSHQRFEIYVTCEDPARDEFFLGLYLKNGDEIEGATEETVWPDGVRRSVETLFAKGDGR